MANQRTDSKNRGSVTVTLLKEPMDKKQAKIALSIGLRRIRHTVKIKDTPSARGMIHKVRHLVSVSD